MRHVIPSSLYLHERQCFYRDLSSSDLDLSSSDLHDYVSPSSLSPPPSSPSPPPSSLSHHPSSPSPPPPSPSPPPSSLSPPPSSPSPPPHRLLPNLHRLLPYLYRLLLHLHRLLPYLHRLLLHLHRLLPYLHCLLLHLHRLLPYLHCRLFLISIASSLGAVCQNLGFSNNPPLSECVWISKTTPLPGRVRIFQFLHIFEFLFTHFYFCSLKQSLLPNSCFHKCWIQLNNIYFLPRTIDNWPLFQTSVFDQTYLLTPRLLQTSYVNALILESRSIIISSFNFKEL